MADMQYNRKSFSQNGNGNDYNLMNTVTNEESDRLRAEKEAESVKVNHEIAEAKKNVKRKKIIPYGNRILIKRRAVGAKLGTGILFAADETKERLTELADVVYVPDHTFCDSKLIENSESIINSLTQMAEDGDAKALDSLLMFNDYMRVKTLRPGDVLMVGKYVGTDFEVGETGEKLSMMTPDGIIGLVVEND